MGMPKISIIVPVYNVEKYIERCLNSLVNQTMKDIEIIVVNDGTLDNSMDICERFAVLDDRIKLFNKENEGLGLARNYGLERATGEFICFVDSDDYVTYDMCDLLYRAAIEHGADIVYGGVYYDDNNNTIIGMNHVKETKIWRGENEVRSLLLDFIATKPEIKNDTIMEVSVWKAIFRRSIFEQNDIRFVSERVFISEDVIFDIDYLSKSQCIVAIPNCVYYYCVNQDSLSKTFRTDRFTKVKELYNEIVKKLQQLYKEDEFRLRTDRFLIARARTNAKKIIKHRKVIGRLETDEALLKIIEDSDLQSVLKRYPIMNLPGKYAIVALLMKKKKVKLLKVLLK